MSCPTISGSGSLSTVMTYLDIGLGTADAGNVLLLKGHMV